LPLGIGIFTPELPLGIRLPTTKVNLGSRPSILAQPSFSKMAVADTYSEYNAGGKPPAYETDPPYRTPNPLPATQQPVRQYTPQPNAGFVSAVPLQGLNIGPAPVDCPLCGVRTMTSISYEAGGQTQYVHFTYFSD
jgi:hypothetical protein